MRKRIHSPKIASQLWPLRSISLARSPKLRAPFVVTAAMMAGCGTSVEYRNPPADVGVQDAAPHDTSDMPYDDTPSPCPPDDPGFGPARAPCSAGSTVRCTYVDHCPDHPSSAPNNVYACIDDGGGFRWTRVSADYTPSCPTDSPKAGDPCPCAPHLGYLACNYGLCETDTRTYASCRGVDTFDRVWNVQPIACNPPEADAGDAGDASDASDAD